MYERAFHSLRGTANGRRGAHALSLLQSERGACELAYKLGFEITPENLIELCALEEAGWSLLRQVVQQIFKRREDKERQQEMDRDQE